ncbi:MULTISPECIES: GNAT family N-acetyltransferase [Chelativorans]|uniref:GNAT family N-acetyltransferase n=1 Tax=Chelativorans TaxID=449972 RepID=UPI0013579B65|nr:MULTISPECIES: GNAT family N-acetyltransferase [Chelativorans]
MTFDPSRIHLEDLGGKGRYVYAADGEKAEMTFTRIGTSQIIIDHTEVPTPFRGQGVGEGLVAHAVEAARKDGVKIRPLCPFAAAQFRRHPEWQDVLAR